MKNQTGNTLQTFEHESFGRVRVVETDGQPWFVVKDVADALGYTNTRGALTKHVDAEDRAILQKSQNATFDISTRGLSIINESSLYNRIRENLKKAERRIVADIMWAESRERMPQKSQEMEL